MLSDIGNDQTSELSIRAFFLTPPPMHYCCTQLNVFLSRVCVCAPGPRGKVGQRGDPGKIGAAGPPGQVKVVNAPQFRARRRRRAAVTKAGQYGPSSPVTVMIVVITVCAID